jgi:hypothetical protein
MRKKYNYNQYQKRTRQIKEEMLKKLKYKLDKLVLLLEKNDINHQGVRHLIHRYKNRTVLLENKEQSNETYTLNKGEAIYLCIYNYFKKDEYGNPILHDDLNLLTFVAIHELAHIMSDSIGHEDEFWDHFQYLLQRAVEWNLYVPIDYRYDPHHFCQIKIDENPYFVTKDSSFFANKLLHLLRSS